MAAARENTREPSAERRRSWETVIRHQRPLRLIGKGRSTATAALSLAILIVLSTGALADVSAPDTPAGHTLQAFLEAFTSADSDRISGYVKQYDPQNSADRLTSFSGQTGGFTLTSIAQSARLANVDYGGDE